jgi:hypothetical protein
MSARDDHFRAKLRPAVLAAALLPSVVGYAKAPAEPEPPQATYNDATAEAIAVLVNFGLNPLPDDVAVADLIRLAYVHGWQACEKRLSSPDVADAIAVAIEHPGRVCTEPGYVGGAGQLRWQVQAVQRAAVYGVPKDLGGGEPP